jgi:hypothetical protein
VDRPNRGRGRAEARWNPGRKDRRGDTSSPAIVAAYVGAGLAGPGPSEPAVLTSQDASGEISGQLVRVVGIFRTGVPEIDQSLIHIPLATAGSWLGTGGDVTQIAVLVEQSIYVDPLRRALERTLAEPIGRGELSIVGWREACGARRGQIDDFELSHTEFLPCRHRDREHRAHVGPLPAPDSASSRREAHSGPDRDARSSRFGADGLQRLPGIALGLFITWYFWQDSLNFRR